MEIEILEDVDDEGHKYYALWINGKSIDTGLDKEDLIEMLSDELKEMKSFA